MESGDSVDLIERTKRAVMEVIEGSLIKVAVGSFLQFQLSMKFVK